MDELWSMLSELISKQQLTDPAVIPILKTLTMLASAHRVQTPNLHLQVLNQSDILEKLALTL
jgi:hypothetical protein